MRDYSMKHVAAHAPPEGFSLHWMPGSPCRLRCTLILADGSGLISGVRAGYLGGRNA